jgi:hypothetical protein
MQTTDGRGNSTCRPQAVYIDCPATPPWTKRNAYSSLYAMRLSEARTLLADSFNRLLG